MNTEPRLSLLVVIAVVSLAGCSSDKTRTAPSPETVRNIPVLAVQQANVPDLLEAVGTVRATQTSDAASQMMGNIVEIRAHAGDQNANSRGQAGSFARDNREFQVEAGTFFTSLDDLRQVVVGVHAGRPVYLRDVVEKLEEGPAEANTYVLFA
jgi:Cu/Ag efflux pump CusA